MTTPNPSTFKAKLQRPAKPGADDTWTFLVLPKAASDTLPRRGRTSVDGTLNGYPFQATLEPDGQLSHWLRVSRALREAADAEVGDTVTVALAPVEVEPEPGLPEDLQNALAAAPSARETWESATTLARVDWIHWIESAKQAKTRARRVENACDMLASGKKRVCCFDPSGFYSKSLSAPDADQ
ncbi:YdeI/OmpD-associated family protein [Marinimicrobium sp. C6131]|uniref:YdeI/OmpD-associated family protein n=1 Tax=Marinimicrobium sp. C6131 TaxID=3022676 RepID=UPI00223E24FD|nr:YdeI/OmpD-associated family protein [Marinimicrobium sp. C6131]UZJ45061.1 YdeI/OmpD-associated family protein [Marinimicrobium sp. C6131]